MEAKEKIVLFKNINWNLLDKKVKEQILTHLSRDNIDIRQICFVDLNELNDEILNKISSKQMSLEKCAIKIVQI